MSITVIVIQIIAFAVAISFHEAAHAWSADKLGDPTAKLLGRVTMNPLKHIDPVMTVLFPAMLIMAGLPPFGAAKPVPVDTRNLAHPLRDHAWIAAAGPISNLILAAGSIVLLRFLMADLVRAMVPASIFTLLILFLSKFVILEVIDFIFGDHVKLGHFVDVLILVLLLIVAQKSTTWVWRRLGTPGSLADDEVLAE